jgi:ferredoxin-NADP reductase/DMSO/TMAO reductase YedYZ heme-binding membrane subunit
VTAAVLAPPRRRTVPAAVNGSRARLDAGVRLGGLIALWSSLLLVTYWWATGGGIQDLGSWAEGLVSTGRLTGLLASDLLLVQVLLMARVPVLERAFGQDRLARIHRWVGFTSFNLMIAHIGLITWGYAAGRLDAAPGELWDLTVTYPGMLLAAAGTACLVMVVVTSAKAARRKLRYESWHLLHLYAYLGVGLALPHQIWTGTEFVSSPWARTYWWSLWLCAAGAVLAFRISTPLWRSRRHQLRVARVVPDAPGVVSVHLTGRDLDRLGARAGQFLTLRFRDGPGWTRANPYSLSAAPHPALLRVTIADAGDGSARAAHLRPGTKVLLEGPYGRLTADARTDPTRPVVLLGAGVGITPLRALLEEIDAPGRTTLVYRARTLADLLFADELDTLARVRGVRLVPLIGPRARPDSWLPKQQAPWDDTAALRRLVPDIADAEVYLCGPTAWAQAVTTAARAAGVPTHRIHQERFSW